MRSKINVLGREYKVSFEDLSGTFGQCDGDAGTIVIQKGCSDEVCRATLLHETIHAILHESGLNHLLRFKTEEALCRALEHGLLRSGLIKERLEDAGSD